MKKESDLNTSALSRNKRDGYFHRRWKRTAPLLLSIAMGSVNVVATVPIGDGGNNLTGIPTNSVDTLNEAPMTGWAVAFDNDILVPSSRDQDYTYGMSAMVSGTQNKNWFMSLDHPLNWLNENTRDVFGSMSENITQHSFEVGLYGFTPEDISEKAANSEDRPYASLMYVSSTQERADSNNAGVVWRSTLTVGVLGLDIVGNLQNEVHRFTNSQIAQGWDNQISDGGELTARYSLARQRLWEIDHPNIEIKSSIQASVGYLTETSFGLSTRIGKIASRWQSYNPELTSYREQSMPVTTRDTESYLSAGFSIKARAYNAFLQGQFRQSKVSLSSDDLNHLLSEVWVGYIHAFTGGYRVGYVLRGHSSEITSGQGNRTVLWGGLTLSKVY